MITLTDTHTDSQPLTVNYCQWYSYAIASISTSSSY